MIDSSVVLDLKQRLLSSSVFETTIAGKEACHKIFVLRPMGFRLVCGTGGNMLFV